MKPLDKFITYTSVFAIFTENFFFNYIIDLKLFYLILIVNFSILIFQKKAVLLSKNHLYFLLFLIVHGLLSVLFFSVPLLEFIKQILGISFCSLFFYALIKRYNHDVLFKIYLDLAFIIAFIAIPMFYLRINVFNNGYRLNGILTEPAHYAAIMLPATYYFFKEKKYLKFSILLITILLSKSTIGYLGLILIVLIPTIKIKYLFKYSAIIISIIITIIIYLSANWNNDNFSEDSNVFVRRIKQTIESTSAVFNGQFKPYTNLSSYALLSNSFITIKNFQNHYYLGSGLGSYSTQYENFYSLLKPPQYLITLEQSKINKLDANSLGLRMLVDFGLIALLFLSYFVFRSFKVFKNEKKIIQQSSFFYLFLKILREGHYFPPEFYFFLFTFIKNSNENTAYSRRLFDK